MQLRWLLVFFWCYLTYVSFLVSCNFLLYSLENISSTYFPLIKYSCHANSVSIDRVLYMAFGTNNCPVSQDNDLKCPLQVPSCPSGKIIFFFSRFFFWVSVSLFLLSIAEWLMFILLNYIPLTKVKYFSNSEQYNINWIIKLCGSIFNNI